MAIKFSFRRLPILLKKLRKKNKWTGTDLARELGVSRQTANYYELGHAYPERWPVISRISVLTGVTIEAIAAARADFLRAKPKE